jgi:pyruvate,orthophosphate dikinase
MTKQIELIGSIYSRNPETGEKSIFGNLWNTVKPIPEETSFDNLPSDTKEKLTTLLIKNEFKLKFPVELIIKFSPSTKEFGILVIKRAKIESTAYPKVLLDLLNEKIITEQELLQQIPLDFVNEWYSNKLVKASKNIKTAKGSSISFGSTKGVLLHTKAEIEKALSKNEKVIWVLDRVSTDDLQYFNKVSGLILTSSGKTSHAAVIARGLGIPTISGCTELKEKAVNNVMVTMNANTGVVYFGDLAISNNHESVETNAILKIAKQFSKVKILANADTEIDTIKALNFGACGVGLCRTEHMFTGADRANLIRQILFSEKPSVEVMEALEDLQMNDFIKIFTQNNGNFINIRLLDAPLHEFEPKALEEIEALAKIVNEPVDSLKINIAKYKESNPMLGFRGGRVLLKNNFIARIQIRAALKAYIEIAKEGKSVELGLEIPMIFDSKEIDMFKFILDEEIAKFTTIDKSKIKIGSMIEIPRAAILIKEIAGKVDYISFGTNDLTQMFFGISRDDSETFMDFYIKNKVFSDNPFVVLDQKGVGELIRTTCEIAKTVNPAIRISVCGEQAADPSSIEFLLGCKVEELSCSAARVPLAIIAAAKYSV